MRTWKLQDAKDHFSELVRRALGHEPQLVTRHGKKAAVVLSAEDYERLVAPDDLVGFLQDSPLADALADGELDLDRPRDPDREVELG